MSTLPSLSIPPSINASPTTTSVSQEQFIQHGQLAQSTTLTGAQMFMVSEREGPGIVSLSRPQPHPLCVPRRGKLRLGEVGLPAAVRLSVCRLDVCQSVWGGICSFYICIMLKICMCVYAGARELGPFCFCRGPDVVCRAFTQCLP